MQSGILSLSLPTTDLCLLEMNMTTVRM